MSLRPMGTALAAALVLVGGLAQPGLACQSVTDMTKNFLGVYPTGEEVARFEGEHGAQVMESLRLRTDADEVVFLYSGHGPVTGARGRYMYLLLDPADCIVNSNWIDGETFDRVIPAK